jgi:hypothetical protein
MNDKPVIRELMKTSDYDRWTVTYRGITKIAKVKFFDKESYAEDLKFKVNKLIKSIERDLNHE